MNRTFERRQRRNDEAVASTLYVVPIGITYHKDRFGYNHSIEVSHFG